MVTQIWDATARRPTWMTDAACQGLPTVMFFPANEVDAALAKAVCGQCPVRRDCVAYALADPAVLGVWGATTERQRHIRRRQLWAG